MSLFLKIACVSWMDMS